MDEKKVIESLSAIERKILPHISENYENLKKLSKKAETDNVTTLRALEFLKKKKLVEVESKENKIIDLGLNGLIYVKKELPERRLLNELSKKKSILLKDILKIGLSKDEAKASIGVLKRKAVINVSNGRVILTSKKELSSKMLEEKLLEKLPISINDLEDHDKLALKNLKERRNILLIEDKKDTSAKLTALGRKIASSNLDDNLIEQLTPKMIASSSWKGKKFRRYDLTSDVPRLYGGKRHFVNQATNHAKKIWLEMGFKEMAGNLVQTGFWNFDALFTAQDHPARELHDTFYIKNLKGKLPDEKTVKNVQRAHEGKIEGSKGWQSDWNDSEPQKIVMRTHTTCLSAQTLKKISENLEKNIPAKYFALGKCFRNETVDWSHGFEFIQTEGIVIDENATFRQLLGYLVEFYKKMGYEKVRIRPHYFPYTEPSLEVDVFHPTKKTWIELGGAGMFRPEVTIPLFGRHIPVLAWGQGVDRIIMNFFNIKDLREMFKNDISKLREMKYWLK